MTWADQEVKLRIVSAFLYLFAVASATAQPTTGVTPPAPPPGSYRPFPVKPKPINTASWFDNLTYPPNALQEGRQGVVFYQLILDHKGKPTNCRILESSGHADLDAMTCDILMKRARFLPARDEENKAIGSWYRGRMRWVPPDDQPVAAVPAPELPKQN